MEVFFVFFFKRLSGLKWQEKLNETFGYAKWSNKQIHTGKQCQQGYGFGNPTVQ